MRLPFSKFPRKLVRIQHTELDNTALEGVWIGMFKGHYHLTTASVVTVDDAQTRVTPYKVNEIMVPANKVAFLEVLAEDQSLAG